MGCPWGLISASCTRDCPPVWCVHTLAAEKRWRMKGGRWTEISMASLKGPKIQTFPATFSFNSGKLMKTYCESVPIGTFGSGRFVQVHTGLLRYTELTMPLRSEEKP